MKLGISSYTYTWAIGMPGYPPEESLTARGLLDKAAALGVSLVQFADNLPLDSLAESEQAELAATADKRNIQVEVGTRGIQSDHLAAYLKLAQMFRSPIVRVVIDTADHHPEVPEVISLLRESLPDYEQAQISLAIENHDRFSVKDFRSILEAVNSPFLGICLDTVNSFGALEGPEVVVESLGPWTVNLHVKDFSVRRADHLMGFVIEGSPAGKGQLDVAWLLESLKPYCRDFNAILELWTPPGADTSVTIAREARWAEESINYLRGLISQ